VAECGAAIEALTSGTHGHAVFGIFSDRHPFLETVVAPIDLMYDPDARRARIRISGQARQLARISTLVHIA
jgi:hypothetical protein